MVRIGIVPRFMNKLNRAIIDMHYTDIISKVDKDVSYILLLDYNQINQIDGLLLMGGNDEKRRDKLELFYINECLKYDKSILGICKGLQMINIALGGTLHKVNGHHIKGLHNIETKENSKIYNILGDKKVVEVNSRHNEAIDLLGTGLVITAYANDNVIEAIEYPSKKFVLGVQWHPENINQAEIYKAFINSMKRSSN